MAKKTISLRLDGEKRIFRLLVGKESRDGLAVIRIAQIVRDPELGYTLSPRYIPPCLNIASSKRLVRLLERRLDELATRSRSIDERRQEGTGTAGFPNAEDFLLLQTINTYVPGLKHLCQVRRGHPELPYAHLLQLAGALCSFSRGADPTQPGHRSAAGRDGVQRTLVRSFVCISCKCR